LHNERNDQLLLRQDESGLCCMNLDGHVIYRYSRFSIYNEQFCKVIVK
jgi:hypothetical protein